MSCDVWSELEQIPRGALQQHDLLLRLTEVESVCLALPRRKVFGRFCFRSTDC